MANVGYATVSVIPSAKGFGKALSSQVDPDLASAGKAGGKVFGGGMLDAAKKFVAPLAGLFAVGAVVDFFSAAATAAMEDQKAVVALATAMDNLGLSSQNAVAEDFVSGLSKATGVADDELRPALQKLLTATGDLAQSQKLLSLAQDISAGTGRDLASVSQALARASTGQVSALTRLGIPLDAGIIKSKDFGAAVDVLSTKFGGQAAAAAATYSGQLQRVQTAAGEAQEAVGGALLNAISNATSAFGGAGGAVDAISAAGDSLANFVTGVSNGVQPIIEFTAALTNMLGVKSAEGAGPFQGIIDVVKYIPIVGQIPMLYDRVAKSGAETAAKQAELSAAFIDGTKSINMVNDAIKGSTGALTGQDVAAGAAAAAVDDLKASFQELSRALSNSQSMDDFRKSLFDLDTTLKGNSRTFKGMGDAAKENRDVLRAAFGDAAQIAQKWAEDNGKSAAQAERYYNGLARKIVDQFDRDGFKQADVEKFLGKQGIWTSPAQKKIQAAANAVSNVAYAAFKPTGVQGAAGVAGGFTAGTPIVQKAISSLIGAAVNTANARLEISSPSKVFFRMGEFTAQGLIDGISSKNAKVKSAAEDMANAILDKGNTILAKWDERLSVLKGRLETARDELASAAKSVGDAIMAGINFGSAEDMTTVGAEGEQVGMTFMEGLRAQAAQAILFAQKVKELIALNLSPAAIQQVLAAGATAGISIANQLITGGATAITETNELVKSAQDAANEVGLLAANTWYGAGVAQAQANYDGFAANYGKGGPARVALENLMDRLAASLDRTSTITIKTVYEAAGIEGHRAMGGPVSAAMAYVVGEKGPEVFVPNSNGNIIPNGSLDFAPAAARSAAVNGAGGMPAINVRVFVGDRELTDIVDTRIEVADARSLDYVAAGRRL
jgi:hypothetical protein